LKEFKEYLKLGYILAAKNLLKISFLIPQKKNRIIFEAYSGEMYGCNPKYISEKLCEEYGDKLDLIWALKDPSKAPDYAKVCKYRSFSHMIYRSTAKVYVCNYLQLTEFPKRKSQIEIQTWHGGGCYKKIGNAEKMRDRAYEIRRDKQLAETDYFIVSSKYWEATVLKGQLEYKGKVLESGMPRNDCLYGSRDAGKVKQIRENAGIPVDQYAVLYAPTWREGMDQFEALDGQKIEQAFETRFGKKANVLFRAHIYGKEKNTGRYDLSDYPDMQELLYACDALITDYSSCIWDFSITGKPCLLYVPDVQRYIDQRGFDKDIYEWGCPVCKTNQELCDAVINIDLSRTEQDMRRHQQDLGTYECGTASQEISDLIGQICSLK